MLYNTHALRQQNIGRRWPVHSNLFEGNYSCRRTCGAPPLTTGVRLHAGHERHVVTEIRPVTVNSSYVGGFTPSCEDARGVQIALVYKTKLCRFS